MSIWWLKVTIMDCVPKEVTWCVMSGYDIIPTSHSDVIQMVMSPFPFEEAALPMGCDAKGMFRGNKRGEVHAGRRGAPS